MAEEKSKTEITELRHYCPNETCQWHGQLPPNRRRERLHPKLNTPTGAWECGICGEETEQRELRRDPAAKKPLVQPPRPGKAEKPEKKLKGR